ncbi:hypothetical protein VNO78_03080 [Psophocarpus tetragonolobus]|uniref:Uncharacterized protein n=1 Tax=Psophocarpus tetragonolobus TaxID=3891 RepID=A0AAN9XVA8_PSOTE
MRQWSNGSSGSKVKVEWIPQPPAPLSSSLFCGPTSQPLQYYVVVHETSFSHVSFLGAHVAVGLGTVHPPPLPLFSYVLLPFRSSHNKIHSNSASSS